MKKITLIILMLFGVANIQAQNQKKLNKLIDQITDEICECLESKKKAKYIHMDDNYSDCLYRIIGIYENEIDSFLPEPEKFYDEELSDEFYDEIFNLIYDRLETKGCEFVFDANLELALEYIDDGEYQKAIEHYKKVPEALMDYEAYNYLGISLFRTEQSEEAIENFIKARELKPFKSTIHTNIAYISLYSGDSIMVMQSLDAAYQCNKTENYFYKYAQYYMNNYDYKNAEILYLRAIEVFPDSINSYLELISMYDYRLSDSAKLFKMLEGAYSIDSTNATVMRKLRSEYAHLGDCEKSAYYNQKYYEAFPEEEPNGYLFIARCFYNSENFIDARKYFLIHDSLDQWYSYNKLGFARCERELQNYDKSLEIINKIIENDSSDFHYFERALTFMAMGNYESALEDYKYIIERDPCNCNYYKERSECYEKLKMQDKAARDKEIMQILFCDKRESEYYYDY